MNYPKNFGDSILLILLFFLNSQANIEFPIDHRPDLSIVSPETSPPKLFPSGLRGVDIPKNSTLRLRCECHEKIYWTYSGYTALAGDLAIKLSGIESKCVKKYDGRKLCESIAIFENVSYEHTGVYTCHHGSPEDNQSSNNIYIFVNDDQCLLIPNDGVPLIFHNVFENQSTTIPCLPTHSKANVTLWKTNAIKDRQIKLNDSVSYDPTQGFHFKTLVWDAESLSLTCLAELEGKNQSLPININWIPDTYDLNPIITSRNADYVVVNQTFTLNCTVDLDLSALAQVSWNYPAPIDSSRIVEGDPRNHKYNHYKAVSRNLTVHNAQPEDAGNYTCSVADASEKVYTASIMIKIYDKPVRSSVNLSTPLDLRHFNLYIGQTLVLVVNVRAIPDLDSVYLMWMKDGQKIGNARGKKNDEDFIINPSHRSVQLYKMKMLNHQAILNVTNVTMMDSGIFSLVGNTTDMSTSINLFVKVIGPPHIELSLPEKLYFTENVEYNINCSVFASPKPEILWQFYPCAPQSCKQIAASDDLEWKVPFEYSPNSEKLIVNQVEVDGYEKNSTNATPIYNLISWRISETLNVKANQSGLYRCVAANTNGTRIKDMMFIVTNAGSNGFSLNVNSSEIVEQEDIELICHASLYNYTELVWYFRPENGSHDEIQPVISEHNSSESSSTMIINYNQNLSHTLTSTIVLKSIEVNSSGLYICNATVRSGSKEKEVHEIRSIDLHVEKIQAPVILETNMLVNDELLEMHPDKSLEFKCYFTGKPRPRIEWLKNGHPINMTGLFGMYLMDNDQKLVINRLVANDRGKYECRIHNTGGHQERFTSLKVIGSTDDGMSLANIMAIVTFLIVALVLVFVAFAVGRKVREDRKQQIEFFTKNLFNNAQMDLINPERPLDEQVDFLPYDPRWEFPSNRLKLIRTLGEGAFGIVILAEAIGLSDEGESELVAVKMLKSHSDYTQKKALIAELKILIHLGRHLNIVNCLGAVTKNLERGKLMVIVEYCRYGSLQTFLQNNRGAYVNQLDPETGEISQKHAKGSDDELDKEKDQNEPTLSLVSNPFYAENNVNLQVKGSNQQLNSSNSRISPISFLSKAMSKSDFREDKSDIEVNTRTLIAYSFQVARGMEYLEQKRLIHRDLAARNVLVSDKGVVKICDFGMAKNVQRDNNYVKKGDGPLPIKWMAIESIGDRIFTIKSDVWSFGVLLWEIFTLGANPYPGVEANQQFYEQLRNGYRMDKPDYCPNSVYRIMSNCWEADSERRPNFTQLSNRLGLLIEESVRDYYLELNNPYQEKNKLFQEEEENYLQMSSCGDNPAEYEYANMNAIMNPPNEPYDAIGKISSSRVAPMEVVPMIHFDTYNDNDNDNRNEESYLNMNISSQSESSPPPNYDLVIDQQAINKPNYANISSVTYI